MVTREDLVKDMPRFALDLKAFHEDCLGYKGLVPPQEDLIDFMMGPSTRKLVLMPRFSYKSTIVTVGWSLWQLVRDTNLRILIYSDSATKAQGFWQDIRNHIEGNGEGSRFREYYGAWESDSKSGKWNDSCGVITVREHAWKEPTVDTGGIETSKVGMHYDVIIFDDIVSDLNTTTKAQMDKVYECYKKSLSLLKPGGKVVVVGTRWHFGDAYGRMIADGGFEVFHVDAERDKSYGEYPFSLVGLTKEFLNEQRRVMGSYLFSCLYNNNPVDDETATFKHADFRFYKLETGAHKDLYITCTCDPAGEGEDFTGITVVGTDREMRMYLLDAVNEHLQPSQIVDKIVKLNYKWGFDKFGVETNFFRGMLEKELDKAFEEERKNKNWKPFSREVFLASSRKGENKHTRIIALQPFHERGDLLFPGESVEKLSGVWSDLAYQMIQFPKGQHDDLIDSLAWHIDIIRAGGKIKRDVSIPPTSAAGIEKRNIDDMIRMNKRIPLRYRKRIEYSFN